MEFIEFIAFIFTKIYHLLDFKILGFPISCIHIILGSIVFCGFITFLRNVSGVVGDTSGFDRLHRIGLKNRSSNLSSHGFRRDSSGNIRRF